MSETYKPGTVALVCVSSDHEPEIGIRGASGKWYVAGPRLGSQHGWYEDHIEIIRPLVVLDPEGIPDLRGYLPESRLDYDGDDHKLVSLIRQIEQQTRPPKPPEPTGLGAVVEDSHGKRWTRYDCQGDPQPWWCDGAGPDIPVERRFSYDDIDAVRVLSEGVSPDAAS